MEYCSHLPLHVSKELMHQQRSGINLVRKLVSELIRQKTEQDDVPFDQLAALRVYGVLDVLDDALPQLVGDFPLLQILSQQPELFLLLPFDLADRRHRRSDTPYERGECQQGPEKEHDRVDALYGVSSGHIHRSWSEVSDRPMQGSRILPSQIRIPYWRLACVLKPVHGRTRLLRSVTNTIPTACDQVVKHQDEEQQFDQLDNDEGVLTGDPVVHFVHQAAQLQQAKQSEDPHDARHFDELAELAHAARRRSCHDPVRKDHEAVHKEPRPEVVLDDFRV
mmetsp:Transcript_28772/g.79278  ORF Transcript_28772/g.79278 Transcript_28772/m.79278 type:complete len:279 (-) Transcript_28772:802-1638(-)